MNLDSSVIRTYLQQQEYRFASVLQKGLTYAEYPLLSTSLTRVSSEPLISIRTASIANGIAGDYCALIGLPRGRGYWISGQKQTPLQAGDLIFIHASEMFTFHFDRSYDAISFNLPRWLLDDVPEHGSVWHGAVELVQLMAERYGQMPEGNNSARQHTERVLLQAVEQIAADPGNRAGSLQLVQQLIQQHASEEDMNIDWLVARSGFSRRYLFKLFHDAPLSLNQFIFRSRLELAYRSLTDPALLQLPLNDIALSCGFKSQAHFSRLFRQQFSITPGLVRQNLKNTIARDIIYYGS